MQKNLRLDEIMVYYVILDNFTSESLFCWDCVKDPRIKH